jgi:uncharacterized protein (DUF2267 family)
MGENKHIIQRQIIELKVQGVTEVPQLQAEISRIYREQIIPLIDRCCSELGEPDRLYRIESLVVDVGSIDGHQLEAELVSKVSAELRRVLAEQLKGSQSPRESSQLELFAFFARTGSLPWWVDASQPQVLEDNLRGLLHSTPDLLRRLLQELLREQRPRQRIAYQYPDELLLNIAALLVAIPEISLSNALKELLAILQTGGITEFTRSRQILWNNVLYVGGLAGQEYSQAESFFQAVLRRVAPEIGTTYSALVSELHQISQEITSGNLKEAIEKLYSGLSKEQVTLGASIPSNLKRVIEQLYTELPNAQVSASDTAAISLEELRTLASRLPDHVRQKWLAALNDLENNNKPKLQAVLRRVVLELGTTYSALVAELHQISQEITSGNLKEAIERLYSGLPNEQVSASDTVAISLEELRKLTSRLPDHVRQKWLAALNDLESENNPKVTALPAAMQQILSQLQKENIPSSSNIEKRLDLSFSDSKELYIGNAGLVILWPFLSHFFTRLDLMKDKQFKDSAACQRAVGLLQYLTTEDSFFLEYLLPLNKVLCGMELTEVFDFGAPILDSEVEECVNLLGAAIEQASILNNMSVPGFRGTFLMRQGVLSSRDGCWLLRVERETFDIVLERFPWSWEWVKLPWMEAPLRVEWL